MQCSLLSLGGKVKDSHISVLINAGVLVSKVEYKALLNLLIFRPFYGYNNHHKMLMFINRTRTLLMTTKRGNHSILIFCKLIILSFLYLMKK